MVDDGFEARQAQAGVFERGLHALLAFAHGTVGQADNEVTGLVGGGAERAAGVHFDGNRFGVHPVDSAGNVTGFSRSMASTKASTTRTMLSAAIISSSGVAKRPNCWRFCPVRWRMLFSLVMPPGGDESKIARLGGWQSGGRAFFHNLTIASLSHRDD